MNKIPITQEVMNVLLMGIRRGYGACQKNQPMEQNLAEVFNLFYVKKSERIELGSIMTLQEWVDKYPGDPEALQDALIVEVERLRALVDSECRRAEEAHGEAQRCALEIEQLRNHARAFYDHVTDDGCYGPAAAIKTFGENERLRAEIERLRALVILGDQAIAESERLRAEVERQKAALRFYADGKMDDGEWARAALGEQRGAVNQANMNMLDGPDPALDKQGKQD